MNHLKHLQQKILIFCCCLFFYSILNAQSPRGFYVGYQAASITGGMNNLRAMVGAENARYQTLSKEMNYVNLLHGISVGYVLRKKKSIYSSSYNKKPFFEINWNNLHYSFTAKGSGSTPANADYTSQYRVRINGLGLLMGIQVGDKSTIKTGFQPSRFSIRYKGSPTSDFDKTEYKHVTDPEGFPEFLWHFNFDYALSNKVFFRTFANVPFDLEKELGYYYQTRNIGLQLFFQIN